MCSSGVLACAVISPFSRYLSISTRGAMSFLETLCQTSLLNKIPFTNHACLSSNPISTFKLPNGISLSRANIWPQIAAPCLFFLIWSPLDFPVHLVCPQDISLHVPPSCFFHVQIIFHKYGSSYQCAPSHIFSLQEFFSSMKAFTSEFIASDATPHTRRVRMSSTISNGGTSTSPLYLYRRSPSSYTLLASLSVVAAHRREPQTVF